MSRLDQFKQPDGTYVYQNCSYKDKEEFIFSGILNLCPCGDVSGMLKYLKVVLDGIKKRDWSGTLTFESSAQKGLFYHLLNNIGSLEHGVGLPVWLSEKGEFVLRELSEMYK